MSREKSSKIFGEIDDAQRDIDAVDFEENKKVCVNGEDYADTFIGRVDKFQERALLSGASDEEIAECFENLLGLLRWVDPSNIEEMRAEVEGALDRMEEELVDSLADGTELTTEEAVRLGVVTDLGDGSYNVVEGWEFGEGGIDDTKVFKGESPESDELSVEDGIRLGYVYQRPDGGFDFSKDSEWEITLDGERIVRKGSRAAERAEEEEEASRDIFAASGVEVQGAFFEDIDSFSIESEISVQAALRMGLLEGSVGRGYRLSENAMERGWVWTDDSFTHLKKWNLDYSNLDHRILSLDDARDLGVVARANIGGEKVYRILPGWNFGKGTDGGVYLVRESVSAPGYYFSVMSDDLQYGEDGIASDYIAYDVSDEGEVVRRV